MPPAANEDVALRAMERNLRIFPWWWMTRWVWLGEGIWVIYLTTERGVTLGEVLLFQAAYSVFVLASEIPTGMLADRWGRRLSVILGSVVAAASMLTFGLAHTVPLLAFSYVLFAVAEALFSGADSAILFDSLKALGRDAEFTRWQAREKVIGGAATGLFTLVGALMVKWVPLEVPFIVSGIASAPAFLLAFALTDPPRTGERHTFLRIGIAATRVVLGRPTLLCAALLMGLVTVAIHTMGISLQPVALNYGVPVWSLGIFVGFQLAFSAFCAEFAERLGRRLGLTLLFLVMPALSALALLGGIGGRFWLYPIFILPSLGWNVLWPFVSDYVARRVDDHVRATALSVASVVMHLMTLAILPVFGFATDRGGLNAGLALAALSLTAASLAVFALWWRAGDRTLDPADAHAA
ncbi:MAG: MFS transporter [Dehalococcoidia bacterium]|nr:MAG: MFS transporter [Dehalococcoidia bacterium]